MNRNQKRAIRLLKALAGLLPEIIEGLEKATETEEVLPVLAKEYGVDRKWIWQRIESGKIIGRQSGSTWLVKRSEIERFLASQQD